MRDVPRPRRPVQRANLAPTAAGERYEFLDALRSLALFGIVTAPQ
jgi:uncharacterized membrane protein YeiB